MKKSETCIHNLAEEQATYVLKNSKNEYLQWCVIHEYIDPQPSKGRQEEDLGVTDHSLKQSLENSAFVLVD